MCTKKNTKRGSYIVEATITIPIFVIAVIMLISIIPSIRKAENYTFSICDEMRLESLKCAFRENPEPFPVIAYGRIVSENGFDNTIITKYKHLYEKNGIDDLITLGIKADFSGPDPLGMFGKIKFSGKVTARAFTGTLLKEVPSSGSEEKVVYIFPENGEKYHGRLCTYIVASCRLTYLSAEIKSKYAPCRLCNASFAQLGSAVFIFEKSGRSYHMSNCKSVERYYIEISEDNAIKQGYTPCSKCGGE